MKSAILSLLTEEEPLSAQKVQGSGIPFHSNKGSEVQAYLETSAQASHKLRLAGHGESQGAQAHLRIESLQSLQNEYDVPMLKTADQQNEENRFKKSEMKMMSPEQNSQ